MTLTDKCRVSIDELNHDRAQSELPKYIEQPSDLLARLRESALFLIEGGTIENNLFGRKVIYSNDDVADRVADDFRFPLIIKQIATDADFGVQLAKDVFLECATELVFDLYNTGQFESLAALKTAAMEQ